MGVTVVVAVAMFGGRVADAELEHDSSRVQTTGEKVYPTHTSSKTAALGQTQSKPRMHRCDGHFTCAERTTAKPPRAHLILREAIQRQLQRHNALRLDELLLALLVSQRHDAVRRRGVDDCGSRPAAKE